MKDSFHSEYQIETIINALNLIDSRNAYIAQNCSIDIVDKWLQFNAMVDMFNHQLSSLRPAYETMQQIAAPFTRDEIDIINNAMQLFDNDVKQGNVDSNCVEMYKALFGNNYFVKTFNELNKEFGGE